MVGEVNLRFGKAFSAAVAAAGATLLLASPASAGDVAKEVVASPNAPEAIGPYSQAIIAGDFIFLAGQIPIDPVSGELMADASIEDQTRLVLNNLKAVLEEAGLSMDNIVKTSVFLSDLDNFGAMNGVYDSFFGDAPPARATVEVSRLPRDVAVEISAIAVR